MRIFFILLVIAFSISVLANDMMDDLQGEIQSASDVKRVIPVGYPHSGREIWLNDPTENWYADRGKDASLDRGVGVEPGHVRWSWTISNSGGGSEHIPDIVVHTANQAVFEEIELNVPQIRSPERLHNEIKIWFEDTIPADRKREYEQIVAACDALILAHHTDAKITSRKLMVYAENESVRAYLILIRIDKKDGQSTWAVSRSVISPSHIQSDLMRQKDDAEIKDHRTYTVIPRFTINSDSVKLKRFINLNTLDIPVSCKLNEK
ncbi:MAG TPA: hypothetical protein VKX17_00680 [Planctomycetota bacterium]|nr:hypothetical protein [Planctomycetota bacterium]